MKSNVQTDHTLIIDELETSIKFHNLDLILGFLPKGSYLVGGYIRDIILGRELEKVDLDIVVPLNAIEIGKKIAENIGSKLIILDEKREVVRIILNNIYIDIANQVSSSIEGDLCSRDFSINSIAFLLDKKKGNKKDLFLLIVTLKELGINYSDNFYYKYSSSLMKHLSTLGWPVGRSLYKQRKIKKELVCA